MLKEDAIVQEVMSHHYPERILREIAVNRSFNGNLRHYVQYDAEIKMRIGEFEAMKEIAAVTGWTLDETIESAVHWGIESLIQHFFRNDESQLEALTALAQQVRPAERVEIRRGSTDRQSKITRTGGF